MLMKGLLVWGCGLLRSSALLLGGRAGVGHPCFLLYSSWDCGIWYSLVHEGLRTGICDYGLCVCSHGSKGWKARQRLSLLGIIP